MLAKFQKGSTLYFAVIILFISFFIIASIASILTVQLQTLKNIGFSILAFYAADSGIERALYEGSITSPPDFSECFNSSLNHCYQTTTYLPDGNCQGSNYCVKSQGFFKNVQRAIEITR